MEQTLDPGAESGADNQSGEAPFEEERSGRIRRKSLRIRKDVLRRAAVEVGANVALLAPIAAMGAVGHFWKENPLRSRMNGFLSGLTLTSAGAVTGGVLMRCVLRLDRPDLAVPDVCSRPAGEGLYVSEEDMQKLVASEEAMEDRIEELENRLRSMVSAREGDRILIVTLKGDREEVLMEVDALRDLLCETGLSLVDTISPNGTEEISGKQRAGDSMRGGRRA